MMRATWMVLKGLSALVAIILLVIGSVIGYELWSMQRKIRAANATAILQGEQVINLNTKFGAADICILPADAFVAEWVSRTRPGYRPKEIIDPDSSLYWAILTFDPKDKSYRYFIVNRRVIELEGERSYCSQNLVVKIDKNNDATLEGKWIATVMH